MSAPTFYGQGNPVLEAAFNDCVRWAHAEPEIVAAFEAHTGMGAPQTPIEAAIDEATGRTATQYEERAEAFIEWVAANIWGIE